MGSMGSHCCELLLRRAARAGERDEERQRKAVVLPLYAFFSASTSLSLTLSLLSFKGENTQWCSTSWTGMIAIACGGTILNTLVTKRLTLITCEVTMGVVGMAILIFDYSGRPPAGTWSTNWTLEILVLDMLLAIDARPWASQSIVAIVCVFLIILTADAALMDDHLVRALDPEPGSDINGIIDCRRDCEQKNGQTGWGWFISCCGFYLIVFLIDFTVTRRFSRGMHDKQQSLEASIKIAEAVGVCLCAYDTDTACEHIARGGDELPPRLRAAMRRLVMNLCAYRPFLPQSALEGEGMELESESSGMSGSTWSQAASVRGTRLGASAWADGDRRGSSSSRLSPSLAHMGSGSGFADPARKRSSDGSDGSDATPRASSKARASPRARGTKKKGTDQGRALSNSQQFSVDDIARAGSMHTVFSADRRSHRDSHESPTSPLDVLEGSTLSRGNGKRRKSRRKPGAGLSTTMQKRRVTALAVNQYDFLRSADQLTPERVGVVLSAYVTAVSGAARSAGGVCDHFLADRVPVSFNAATACNAHSAAAVRCAWQAERALRVLPARGSCGVASGAAVVGNAGSAALTRFSVVGAVACVAPVLERLGRAWGAAALCDEPVRDAAGAADAAPAAGSFHFRLCGQVVFAKRGPDVMRVWSPEAEAGDKDPDLFAGVNRAMQHYLAGEYSSARDQVEVAAEVVVQYEAEREEAGCGEASVRRKMRDAEAALVELESLMRSSATDAAREQLAAAVTRQRWEVDELAAELDVVGVARRVRDAIHDASLHINRAVHRAESGAPPVLEVSEVCWREKDAAASPSREMMAAERIVAEGELAAERARVAAEEDQRVQRDAAAKALAERRERKRNKVSELPDLRKRASTRLTLGVGDNVRTEESICESPPLGTPARESRASVPRSAGDGIVWRQSEAAGPRSPGVLVTDPGAFRASYRSQPAWVPAEQGRASRVSDAPGSEFNSSGAPSTSAWNVTASVRKTKVTMEF